MKGRVERQRLEKEANSEQKHITQYLIQSIYFLNSTSEAFLGAEKTKYVTGFNLPP